MTRWTGPVQYSTEGIKMNLFYFILIIEEALLIFLIKLKLKKRSQNSEFDSYRNCLKKSFPNMFIDETMRVE